MIKFDHDDGTEKYLRLVSKIFVSSIKQLPEKDAEQLAYETLKLTYITVKAIKQYKERNNKGGR